MAPLGILLAASRPRTMREYLWIFLAALVLGTMLQQPASLSDRTIRAAGLFFTGTYVTLALLGNRSLFMRSVVAAATAAAFTAGWFIALRISFDALRASLLAPVWEAMRRVFPTLPTSAPAVTDPALTSPGVADMAQELARSAQQAGELYPAVMALSAMAGGWLAWTWYHRLASTPIGSPPGRFRDFRFSDQLVWWLVLALAGSLVDLPTGPHLVVKNLLVVILAIFAMRGLAVLRTMLTQAPPLMTVLLCVLALPLLPLAFAGCVVLGVADIWLDLRRRLPPPEGVSR